MRLCRRLGQSRPSMDIQDLLGYIAATLTTVAFVPQAWKTFRSRDVSGISLGMYSLFTAGVALWLVYGILMVAWPIIIANSITTSGHQIYNGAVTLAEDTNLVTTANGSLTFNSTLNSASARVISHIQIRLHLDHLVSPDLWGSFPRVSYCRQTKGPRLMPRPQPSSVWFSKSVRTLRCERCHRS